MVFVWSGLGHSSGGKVGEQEDPEGAVRLREEEVNSGLERGLDETVSWYGEP